MPIDEDAVELARQILNAACDSTVPVEAIDLEAAVVRSLTLLTMGHAIDFREYQQPPGHIQAWLQRASADEVRGLLMMTLRRWHELRGREKK